MINIEKFIINHKYILIVIGVTIFLLLLWLAVYNLYSVIWCDGLQLETGSKCSISIS
jgi:hypothetical protein